MGNKTELQTDNYWDSYDTGKNIWDPRRRQIGTLLTINSDNDTPRQNSRRRCEPTWLTGCHCSQEVRGFRYIKVGLRASAKLEAEGYSMLSLSRRWSSISIVIVIREAWTMIMCHIIICHVVLSTACSASRMNWFKSFTIKAQVRDIGNKHLLAFITYKLKSARETSWITPDERGLYSQCIENKTDRWRTRSDKAEIDMDFHSNDSECGKVWYMLDHHKDNLRTFDSP